MAFRMRKDARHWFRDIEPPFPVDFDIYYFCLIAGFATGRKTDVGTADATDLVESFPGVYRASSSTIVALFLSRELKKMGISLSERGALHTAIRHLVDPRSPSYLSDEGMRQMNRYAFGGYEVLTEWFEDRPRHLETFLPLLKRRMDAGLGA